MEYHWVCANYALAAQTEREGGNDINFVIFVYGEYVVRFPLPDGVFSTL